ncbi:MAG: hypothetical protein JSW29_03520, partial [Candidatus Bathyarchaeota archaeon]
KILLHHLSVSPKLKNTLVDAVLMPRARLKEGLALAQVGAATASIDSSDGLAWSLHEISKASEVGFIITNLPVASETRKFAETHGLDPVELSLYGGEEYELVVTVKPELWKTARSAASLIKIGFVTKERKLFLKAKGIKTEIEPRGWEHFKTKVDLLSS